MVNKIKLICVDSDGCAVDSMNIKHIKSFSSEMIREFHLEPIEAHVRDIWYRYNLFSATRGQNRFITLAYTLQELKEEGLYEGDLEPLQNWLKTTPAVSNKCLYDEWSKNQAPVLKKAYDWSIATNKSINEIPKEEINPFPGVYEALKAASQKSQVAIVSSANGEAVNAEWTRFGLLEYVDETFTQEHGTKKDIIGKCLEEGYEPHEIIMCGDSPGDLDAAVSNGVYFYPIIVGKEEESWNYFLSEVIPHLEDNAWFESIQPQLVHDFKVNLGMEK